MVGNGGVGGWDVVLVWLALFCMIFWLIIGGGNLLEQEWFIEGLLDVDDSKVLKNN